MDFPHPLSAGGRALLVDLLPRFGDTATLQRLLVDNPAPLHGFQAHGLGRRCRVKDERAYTRTTQIHLKRAIRHEI